MADDDCIPDGDAITADDLSALVARMTEAADAYIRPLARARRGDVRHYLSLFDHPSDYTLMPPYGGPTSVGFELRVTLVFRRDGERWQVVHRHADPLVRAIPFEHCAQLARGLTE
ncbi:nuclear transport factor 2 family protein [Motilibacter deserti]|uniref:Nuclear transport factor 2 family protein n=1 Tax=Motilibacter deserti TaxID=2714956 RepID=A0ABX0H2F6_9ACTN|nr:nuclear transport factor 2 family protein [Motilibacter deserti]NHC15917.1 nuclear transport factor 2 family protein [Motilibacter deserti]